MKNVNAKYGSRVKSVILEVFGEDWFSTSELTKRLPSDYREVARQYCYWWSKEKGNGFYSRPIKRIHTHTKNAPANSKWMFRVMSPKVFKENAKFYAPHKGRKVQASKRPPERSERTHAMNGGSEAILEALDQLITKYYAGLTKIERFDPLQEEVGKLRYQVNKLEKENKKLKAELEQHERHPRRATRIIRRLNT